MVRTYLSCLIGVVSLIAGMSEAVAQQVSSQKYGIILGASRVVYPPDSRGVTLSVTNPVSAPMI